MNLEKLFDSDGKIMHLMDQLWKIIMLNMLFLVYSLPIFTLFPALAALNVSIYQLSEDDFKCTKEFHHNFTKYFRRNVKLDLLVVAWLVGTLSLVRFFPTVMSSFAVIFPFLLGSLFLMLILMGCLLMPSDSLASVLNWVLMNPLKILGILVATSMIIMVICTFSQLMPLFLFVNVVPALIFRKMVHQVAIENEQKTQSN